MKTRKLISYGFFVAYKATSILSADASADVHDKQLVINSLTGNEPLTKGT